jgi:hypothetical protein
MTVVVNTEKPWTNYATIWKIELQEKYADVTISTSEQVEVFENGKKTGEKKWENSNWFARFIGHAKEKVKDMNEKDRIILTSFKIKNVYDKEKGKSYINFAVFDFEIAEAKESSGKTSSKGKEDQVPW